MDYKNYGNQNEHKHVAIVKNEKNNNDNDNNKIKSEWDRESERKSENDQKKTETATTTATISQIQTKQYQRCVYYFIVIYMHWLCAFFSFFRSVVVCTVRLCVSFTMLVFKFGCLPRCVLPLCFFAFAWSVNRTAGRQIILYDILSTLLFLTLFLCLRNAFCVWMSWSQLFNWNRFVYGKKLNVSLFNSQIFAAFGVAVVVVCVCAPFSPIALPPRVNETETNHRHEYSVHTDTA